MLKRIKSAVLPSSTKGLVVGLMVAALLVVTAGFVAAQSITAPPKVINGCSDKNSGALRIVTSTSLCKANETPQTWNAVGPEGPPGPQGPPGDKGDTGLTGDTGPKGDTGATGAQGEKGDQGATGPAGPEGPKGEQGLQGPQGEQGAKGDKGDTGDTGAQGLQGERGPQGADGAQGPQGLKGDKGDTGLTGDTGPMGPKGADGATGPKGDTGDTGVAGPQGPSGVSGYTRVAKRQQFAPRDGVRVVVDCPDGTEALGGGYSIGGQFEPIEVKESYPTPRTMPGNGWTVTAFNHDFLFVGAVTVYAMCADVTSP